MNEIVGRGFWPRWARWAYVVFFALVVASAIWARTFNSLWNLVSWGLLGLACLRRPPRVTRSGVTVPRIGRWTRRISWDDVEAVAPPGRFESVPTLLLTNGRDVPLEGIDAEWAPTIAELGGKPLRDRPRPAPAQRPASSAEVERDLERRAADLAAERTALRAEFDKIKRKDT